MPRYLNTLAAHMSRFIAGTPLGRALSPAGFLAAVLLAVSPAPAASQTASPEHRILDRLELRSIFAMGNRPEFSLHDGARDMTFWIALGQTRHGITVTNYYQHKDSILVEYGTRRVEVGLSEIEIKSLEDVASTETPSDEQTADTPQRAQRNPEEELRELLGAWEAGVAENPRLRQLDDHLNEYYDEFQQVRQQMWQTTDHDSEEFQQLRRQRQELREEIQVLHELTAQTIGNDERFENIDQNRLMAALRHNFMSRGQEEPAEPQSQ